MDETTMINKTTICMVQMATRSRGIFFGDNPLDFAGPILLVQLILSALLTALVQHFLTPLGETAFVSQTIVGVALGPSVLGKIRWFRDQIFPPKSFYVSETFAYFGLMIFLFLVGVKMDISALRQSGRRAVVIGVCNFFIPLALNEGLAFLLLHAVPMDPLLHHSLAWIASFQCLSSFHVIACLLADLKLLNSELGRLAVSSSMISGLCSWSWALILFMGRQNIMSGKRHMLILMSLLVAVMIAFIVYVLRPLMFWMIQQTGEDKAVKESYIFIIFIMVLGCSLFGEIIGQHFLLGPIILGLAVPEGPPLGSALVSKLDSYVSSILLPIYFVISGSTIDFSMIRLRTFGIVELLAVFGFLWKVMGTMLPSLYCDMSVKDSVSLALIMSVQGIIEVLIIGRAAELEYIDRESYSIMVISLVIFNAATAPIVKVLYNPSKKYIARKRMTIQHAKAGAELRLLACIYHEDQTPSIINLLEASNPTAKSPIFFYVIHLIELSGRSAPLLMAHQLGKRTPLNSHHSDHINNAFRLYEQHNQGTVMVNPFTAISPFATMHDEVCALALDRKVCMVILPFHKCWTIEGTEGSANAIRTVNCNILRTAPCSVGVLVDRGTLGANAHKTTSKTSYSIGVIFLGGQDDREALAYANRMSKHPNVALTVVRLIEYSNTKYKTNEDMEHDFELINEFRFTNSRNKSCVYKEEVVNDSVGVVSVIRTIENSFDLILVGRRHNSFSQLLRGLMEWNEFSELGFIGDMLSSSDSNCKVSVLVVQQQAFAGGDMVMDSPKSTVLDMSWDNNAKVWPASH
ncbi:Cation/H(+) antiporter like [Actinidia chinensis var. chinensis]|uniref:Cation/H(+) antiporter like n=1 Tax=Actinidia chinensis var. chinensis TaxID=1590841 RepID=A0A2R6QJE7_ACTCC|nr:Cation/H(+) antiporter like [Actinidia chinensis var. chinensis]